MAATDGRDPTSEGGMSKTPAELLSNLQASRYRDLLRTFEWRQFRQRVFKAKGGRCEVCRVEGHWQGLALQVHHNFYDSSRLPWEYQLSEVRLLCDRCHEGIEEGLRNFRKFVTPLLTPEHFKQLNGMLAVALLKYERTALLLAMIELASDSALVSRLCSAQTTHDFRKETIKESLAHRPEKAGTEGFDCFVAEARSKKNSNDLDAI